MGKYGHICFNYLNEMRLCAKQEKMGTLSEERKNICELNMRLFQECIKFKQEKMNKHVTDKNVTPTKNKNNDNIVIQKHEPYHSENLPIYFSP